MGRNSGGVRSGSKGNSGNSSFDSSLEEYISGDGMWINKWLRGQEDFDLNSGEKKYLNDLDSATAKPLGKDMTLYRAVDATSVFGRMSDLDYDNLRSSVLYGDKQRIVQESANKILSRAKPGTIKQEKGFMSTSKDRNVADDWGGFSGSDKPIVLKLSVPKHIQGADLSKHEMAQGEILLKRGQRYKIKKVYGQNGNIYVDAAII